MVFLVDDDILAVVGASPTLNIRIDVLRLAIGGIRRLADVVFVERERVRIGRHFAAPRVLIRPLGRFEFLVDVELFAGFEHQDFHPVLGEHVRGHSARCARSDYDGVIGFI